MRTFIAIDLPQPQHQLEEISHSLQTFLQQRKAPNCLQWAPLSNAHLTLRFLGDTSAEQTHNLSTYLQAVATQHQPFELALGTMGCYPTMCRPRVVWSGIEGEISQLQSLQAQIEDAAQHIGFDSEKRPYSPHITLARIRRNTSNTQAKVIGQLLQEYRRTETILKKDSITPSFMVNEFVHMKSELKPSGAVYTPLQSYHLSSGDH